MLHFLYDFIYINSGQFFIKELCKVKTVFLFFIAVSTVFFSFCANAKPLVVEASVRDNPTVFFKGIEGSAELTAAVRSFLGACGWFDLVSNPKADYQLSGKVSGNVFSFNLTLGGAPLGAWQMPVGGADSRKLAAAAVDTVIEKSFRELKVRGFCSSKIAFCAQTAPGVRNIYMCDIDGNNSRQITRFNTLCVEPSWSPSGNSVIYSKYTPTGIAVIESEIGGAKRSRLLSAFSGINAGAAQSPAGRELALILSPDKRVDLYVLDLNSRKLTRLTRSKSVEASPCWSPDGRQIAYVSDETGSPRIFVSSRNGSNRRRLPSIGRDAVTPDWSGDNKIVYASRVGGTYALGVYDMAGNSNKQITRDNGNWESPAWAADFRHVVAKCTRNGKSGIYVVDTWTGKIRPLITTTYPLSMPAWSPCRRRTAN